MPSGYKHSSYLTKAQNVIRRDPSADRVACRNFDGGGAEFCRYRPLRLWLWLSSETAVRRVELCHRLGSPVGSSPFSGGNDELQDKGDAADMA